MRIEPHLESKNSGDGPAPDLRADRREIKLSRADPAGSSQPLVPKVFKFVVVVAVAWAAWTAWAFFSAVAFVSAFNRSDRVSLEDYVDRAAFSRSIEVAAAVAGERNLRFPPAIAGLIGAFAADTANSIPTLELFSIVLPKAPSARMIWPIGLARYLVTVTGKDGTGTVLYLSYQNLGWRISGIRF